MPENNRVLGRVAVSRAGRDRGRAFLIVGIADESSVLLADGVVHKLVHPKKKKLKHLDIMPESCEALASKLSEGLKIFDAEVRRNLMMLGYNTEEEQEG